MYSTKTLSWLTFYVVALFMLGPITQFTNPESTDSIQKLIDFYLAGITVMLMLVLFKFQRTKQTLPEVKPARTAILNYIYYFAIFFILTAMFFFSGGWGIAVRLIPGLQVFGPWLSTTNVIMQFVVAGSEFLIFIFAMPYLIRWNISYHKLKSWTIGFNVPFIGDPLQFIAVNIERSISYMPAAAIAALMHTGTYFRIFVIRNPTVDPYSPLIITALITSLIIAFIMFIIFYIVYVVWGTGASIALHHAYNLTNDWIN